MSRFDSFDSFLHYLDNLGMFHMDLGLDRMRSALETLDLTRPPCLSVQVIGTNGKGSTSTFLACIFRAVGMKTGLYTSPHFLSPRERILVDGAQLPEAVWLEAAEAVLRVSEDRSEKLRLTYFELLTVMAAWMFRQSCCRACVFEAGLGGAHDATTSMSHDLTVYTPIGLDHVAILGPTIEDIARDKAGAMRTGVPAVTAPQEPGVMDVLAQAAGQAGTTLTVSHDEAPLPPHPAMPGPHQSDNLALALAAYRLLAGRHGLSVDAAALARAAGEAFIPGRFQMIPAVEDHPAYVLDGAHNQPGLECLARALEDRAIKPATLIFACLGDKDLEAMLPLVRSLTAGPIFAPGLNAPGRALDPADLAARIAPQARPVRDMAEAMEQARSVAVEVNDRVLICGSLYLLAEAFRLHPEWLVR